ncbi:hypothetical protein [Pseudosporangium ferrugineum]|uniref:Uncharacterized protein n=1 Tax=Pseudosporangium ferrugineum TaxID=439699 RepID=A0A2T0S2G2_9ACTN|nr:hypothetical protein [Pseudosporangium ferrugineum]PRY27609.1 hypothetical protein CLV70_110196 [Pseudosporangium ferrugineum]
MSSDFQIGNHRSLYVLLTALCLVVAVRHVKRAIAPVGTLVEAAFAATIVAFATGMAVAFAAAAALSR